MEMYTCIRCGNRMQQGMHCSCGSGEANDLNAAFSKDAQFRPEPPREYRNFDTKGCVQGVIFFLIVCIIIAVTNQGR